MLTIREITCEYSKNKLGCDEQFPRFSWLINSNNRDILQTSSHLQVSTKREFSTTVMDTGMRESNQSVLNEYKGPPLQPFTRYYYRVQIIDNRGEESPWSDPGWFETGIMDSENWIASFISPEGEDKPGESAGWYLEKEIVIEKEIVSARIYATALGLYRLSVNGEEPGENVLSPGWTNYDKRLLYQSYDVSSLLKAGKNTLKGHLGCGWYKGELMGGRNFFGKRNALSLQMLIRFADGEERWIITDENWKSNPSPVLFSEIYHGEIYDARKEKGEEISPFSSKGVIVLHQDKSIISAQDGPLIKRQEILKVKKIIRTPRRETVLDFGQNLTGWVRFRVRGKSGEKVILKHAEILDRKGNFYTKNLRRARQEIRYILKGGEEEVYEPCFTFQGFRYVHIKSWPGEIRAEDFDAVVVHSEMEDTGSFCCSSELVNQLHHNILWSMKGNFLDIPSDCPQRNERLGWTGDAQAFVGTAVYLKNTSNFYRKWLRDLKSEQTEDGGIPDVIPDVLSRKGRGKLKDPINPFNSSAGWSDAAVICPRELYMSYGDKRILEELYETMSRWISYVRRHSEDGLIWKKGFQYGDWLALDRKRGNSSFGATPNNFVATAFYANSVQIAAETAEKLGFRKDAESYSSLHDHIINAFRERFLDSQGHLKVKTQTAQVLALQFNLIPNDLKAQITEDLVQLIKESGNHLTTGFLGTVYLTRILAKQKRNDIACRLLLREEYPSWLYPVKLGATTIWERWDGVKPDGKMQSKGMNSFNHYAYGAVGQYLYGTVAGITPTEPGYWKIQIKPHPGEGLSHSRADLKSPYGHISVEWKINTTEINTTEMNLSVSIPPNTSARVYRPVGNSSYMETEGLLLGSGNYKWTYPYKEKS